MVSYVNSGTVLGINSYIIKVETDASSGLPAFDMVGMLNSEVKEAKERVKVSLKNNGFSIPPLRITINLSPANLRKGGTKFDLPIAVSLLIALGEIKQESTKETVFLGELGLNGELRFVDSVLPIVLEAKEQGFKRIILPMENAYEGAAIEGIDVYGMDNIIDVIRFLTLDEDERAADYIPVKINIKELFENNQYEYDVDFSEVSGQRELKRACIIAATGFHHMLMVGNPGCGKTMVAKRLVTILPPLSYEESLEVSKIYSVAGRIKEFDSLIVKRPFNSPHHTITESALSGGGSIPKPGVISLSHRGILFLDEAVHFDKRALEVLRQPLEDRKIIINRSLGTFEYPSDFILVAAINPCPCGYYPDRNKCKCTDVQIKNYTSKLSGPILDRFNGEMSVKEIEKYCKINPGDEVFLEKAFRTMNLSARSFHKILRVSRTIADLDSSKDIQKKHLCEALNYRMNVLYN